MGGLHRLPLTARRQSPDPPVIPVADSVARIPKLRGDSAVNRIFVHGRNTSLLNPPGRLHSELKIQSFIVDRPTLISVEYNSIGGIGQTVLVQRPGDQDRRHDREQGRDRGRQAQRAGEPERRRAQQADRRTGQRHGPGGAREVGGQIGIRLR